MKPAYILLIALGLVIVALVIYLAYGRSITAVETRSMGAAAGQGVQDAYDTTKEVIKEDAAAVQRAAEKAKEKAAEAVK